MVNTNFEIFNYARKIENFREKFLVSIQSASNYDPAANTLASVLHHLDPISFNLPDKLDEDNTLYVKLANCFREELFDCFNKSWASESISEDIIRNTGILGLQLGMNVLIALPDKFSEFVELTNVAIFSKVLNYAVRSQLSEFIYYANNWGNHSPFIADNIKLEMVDTFNKREIFFEDPYYFVKNDINFNELNIFSFLYRDELAEGSIWDNISSNLGNEIYRKERFSELVDLAKVSRSKDFLDKFANDFYLIQNSDFAPFILNDIEDILVALELRRRLYLC